MRSEGQRVLPSGVGSLEVEIEVEMIWIESRADHLRFEQSQKTFKAIEPVSILIGDVFHLIMPGKLLDANPNPTASIHRASSASYSNAQCI